MISVSTAFGWTSCLFVIPTVVLWASYSPRRYVPGLFIAAILLSIALFVTAILAIWLPVWGL